jgi:hypothetical protein
MGHFNYYTCLILSSFGNLIMPHAQLSVSADMTPKGFNMSVTVISVERNIDNA